MDIQPADPAQRRRVLGTLASVAILLLAVVIAFEFWLQHVSASLDGSHLVAVIKPMLMLCVMLIAACFAALGLYGIVRGRRIVCDQRYPPRDARVVRATRVREGPDAVRIGQISQIGGLVLCVAGVAIAICGLIWAGHFG